VSRLDSNSDRSDTSEVVALLVNCPERQVALGIPVATDVGPVALGQHHISPKCYVFQN
jgi:hypothetical protein